MPVSPGASVENPNRPQIATANHVKRKRDLVSFVPQRLAARFNEERLGDFLILRIISAPSFEALSVMFKITRDLLPIG